MNRQHRGRKHRSARASGRGWHYYSYEHSLAARGIRSRGIQFSSIKSNDDLEKFLKTEKWDILKSKIATAKADITKDRRDLSRFKDIDERILAASESNPDLAEILIEQQMNDPDFALRASGVLRKLKEKITGHKIKDQPKEVRISEYNKWFVKELDRVNGKLSSATNQQQMAKIKADFNAKIARERSEFGLKGNDVKNIEKTAISSARQHEPTERTKVVREKNIKNPIKYVSTAAAMAEGSIQDHEDELEAIAEDGTIIPVDTNIPGSITSRFGDMDIIDYGSDEGQIAEQQSTNRDLVVETASSQSLEVQEDLSRELAKDRQKAEANYWRSKTKNQRLRSDIGTAMQEEWDIMGDELIEREQLINDAERALAAGGIRRGRWPSTSSPSKSASHRSRRTISRKAPYHGRY